MPADVVYDAVLGSLTLKQVFDGSYSANATPVAGTQSGGLDVDTYYGGPAEPRATFSSSDLGTILGVSNICTAGLAVSSGTITIPWQKRANKGTFAGSLSNFVISGTNGLIFPTSFSVSQDDDAGVANLECVFQSTDGVTNPVSTAVSQSLSSQSFSAIYGLGTVKIDGTTLGEVVGFTVNTGLSVTTEKHNGGLYPTKIYIVSRRPSIDVTFNDFDDVNDVFGSVWTSIGSSVVAYMRKRSGTGYVADGTAQHVSFSGAAGIIGTETLSASGAGSGTATVRLYIESLTVSAATAIS